MFMCTLDEQLAYIKYMETLKAENRVRREMALRKQSNQIHQSDFFPVIRKYIRKAMNNKNCPIHPQEKHSAAHYFSEHRIAVYTCIIGDYDRLLPPACKPNNVDYFIASERSSFAIPKGIEKLESSQGSGADFCVWSEGHCQRQGPKRRPKMCCQADAAGGPRKPLRFLGKGVGADQFLIHEGYNIVSVQKQLAELTPAEQNRWYKMHPHLLFPEYEYSIYLDGNITPISDLTEFVHCIGSYGIATHQHPYRNCAYQEAQAVLQRGKDNPKRINSHVDFLREEKFPEFYGLADCGVIARRHHHPFCVALMEQWWSEFLNRSKRDQISFPYLLFKSGVKMEEITTLGPNRMYNDALYISKHNA